MRALRILLVLALVLGGLFVLADRLALNYAEDRVAERLKNNEGLARTPDVSVQGFPFLTQLAGGRLDEVRVGIEDFEASAEGTGDGGSGGTGGDAIRIDRLDARLHGVTLSGDYSSATADSATGTATIGYDELLRTAKAEPIRVTSGITARVVGLSDGGDGKIKVQVEATVLGTKLPQPVTVLSSVAVKDDRIEVRADSLPDLGVALAENKFREITDIQQRIDGLPGGIALDKVAAAKDGVEITVKGSDVELAG
ncbi:LmeA family phospholipid-binding protein [Streptomyces minutiscleroticus]|uniref:Secreted protein n=1 Tax=Streptomyces minutiscleroticus TaxID=68238 RepID=A0A918NV50_9ACTN|nr:DUF2993 domain-containing protein [Streptomyces minutiscleroticus]GGX98877.1 hypothetical protein GCM10010358_60690 [Streptomyces minutiscleroticus]